MTKVIIQGVGWVYLQVVLDWFTKKITGCSLSFTSKSGDWLDAFPKNPTLLENSAFSPKENLPLAENSQFPLGIRDSLKGNLYLVSDNGSQPTSLKFMQACKDLGIKQIFTSPLEADQPQADYNKPKANADTVCQRQIRLRRKRVRRTLKEDLIWIKEFTPPEELRQDLERWIHNYSARGRSTSGGNAVYPHFSLNYKTPLQIEEDYYRLGREEKVLETQQIFV